MREPAQPPQDVADVRAEHAAVDVGLVDDDVTQVVQNVGPAIVVRQHADVEHVWVRQDDICPLADLPMTFAGRVAVVDGGADVRRVQLGQRPRLILRERLRRIEVQRTALWLSRDRVEDGEVERERLARRRTRCQDQVLAARCGVVGSTLMFVELVEGKRFPQAGVQAVWQQCGASPRSRDLLHMCDLFALE